MSGEDKKEVPAPTKPANKELRTLVGVPVLESARAAETPGAKATHVPAASPSATLLEPPKADAELGEPNTAVDVKAMSNAEAERVLQWTGFTQEEIPTVNSPKSPSGNVPASPVTSSSSSPPPPRAGAMVTQVGTPALSNDPRATTRGVAPPPPRPLVSQTIRAGAPGPANPKPPSVKPPPPQFKTPPPSKGRSTLVMDAGAPPEAGPLSSTGERPAIVVPAASALAPKAVTQPPPWGEGSVELSGIPHAGGLPRPPEDSVEELSGSVLLPADDLEATRQGSDVVEELSGSILLPDDSAPPKNAPPPKSAPMKRAAPPTQRGHAPIVAPHAANAPTKESPVFPPHASAPPHAPPPAPAPAPALAPASEYFAAHSARTPPMPMPVDNAPEASVIIDPTLPPGVPVPPPPDLITHPAWPPSMKPPPPAETSAPSSVPPRSFSSAPPGTTSAPNSDRLGNDGLDEFGGLIPATSLLRTRPKWFLPVVVAGGVVVSIGMLGLMISGLSKGEDLAVRASPAVARAASSVAERSTSAAMKIPSTPAANTVASAVASTVSCTAGASARVVAPRAVVSTGVEALAFDGALGVGFAASANEGVALLLDPSTLAVMSTAKTKSLDTIRRLSPKLSPKKNAATAADVERRADRIRGRRTIVSPDGSIDVGVTGDALVAGADGAAAGARVFTLEGEGTVDAIRGVAVAGSTAGEKTWAFAFRRGSAIWLGAATGDKTLVAKGALSRVDGLGEKVGSPAIAASGDTVMVAWADRKSDAEPWSLRVVRFKPGDAPTAPTAFAVPAGGLGQHAMSPGVAGLAGGRFLLVWTEGPVSSRQVRAQTLTADGAPLGGALAISADGVYAGQGQAAVVADGRGLVAFLGAESADAKKFEVMATPITCPP